MHAICVPSVLGVQRRMSDPLEPELGVVLSHHVGAGHRTGVLCRSTKCPQLLSNILQAPPLESQRKTFLPLLNTCHPLNPWIYAVSAWVSFALPQFHRVFSLLHDLASLLCFYLSWWLFPLPFPSKSLMWSDQHKYLSMKMVDVIAKVTTD